MAKLIKLWTWQGKDFCLHNGIVDPAKGQYDETVNGYLIAIGEIAEHLGTNQFLWAGRERNPHPGRVGYCFKIPEDDGGILAVIDSYRWDLRLGLRGRAPQKLELAWRVEAVNLYPDDDGARRTKYENCQRDEWWDTLAAKNWWESAIAEGGNSDAPQYLLRYPLPIEWKILQKDESVL